MGKNMCSVCNSTMNCKIEKWHWVCSKCEYEKSDLAPAINETVLHEQINESLREKGLKSLRVENFEKLLQKIIKTAASKSSLLDVGCAHGWFLEAAMNHDFQVTGIEPDTNVFNTTAQRGLRIRHGFFPDVLLPEEKFDIIVFNDVFEHIPDLRSVLEGCNNHLTSNGVLVLNLPSSSGLFYKFSKFLTRLGINSFFERLWQKGLPSPHIHYFNSSNLKLLLESNGFEQIGSGRLSTVRIKGLFTRISVTKKNHSLFVRILISLLVSLTLPLILLMPSDIIYSISKKK